MTKNLNQDHCSQCGNTNLEDVDRFNPELDGYSACCNEPIVRSCASSRCHHSHR